MKIQTHTPPPSRPDANSAPGSPLAPPPEEPRDVFVPTAVKLYDMSPVWGPEPWDGKLPRGVRGFC